MENVLTSRKFVMVFHTVRMVRMSIVVHMAASVIPISLCAAIPSVSIESGAVMVKMIVATILMRKVVILSRLELPAVMMNSSAAVVIVYQSLSNVTTPMIAAMAVTKSVAVSISVESYHLSTSFALTDSHIISLQWLPIRYAILSQLPT